jgi:hypothetical protein
VKDLLNLTLDAAIAAAIVLLLIMLSAYPATIIANNL